MVDELRRAAELIALGRTFALVTVVRSSGSTPRGQGSKMLVHADGTSEGTVGGGRLEADAIAAAIQSIQDGQSRYLELQLTQELGMCCGGQVALFIEPLLAAPKLLIFGAGHVGAALTKTASAAGFVVHVADEREEMLKSERLPAATKLYDRFEDPGLPFGPDCLVMVTTHDHALDQRLVELALKTSAPWVGMIGSRRKATLTRERLAHKGFTDADVRRLRSPVGLAIGAETPAEIAVSITAELIAVRRHVRLDEGGAPRVESKSDPRPNIALTSRG